MKRIAIASIACLWASLAFGQANGVSTFMTPGNQTVPGYVPLGVSPSGIAGGAGSGNAGYPPGATAVSSGNSATTGGISASLAAAANQFTYLCGFSVSPGSATAAITITAALGNLTGAGPSNMTWALGAPITAAGTTGANFTMNYWPCMRSNTMNQSITLTVGPLGAGGVNQFTSMWGYTQ